MLQPSEEQLRDALHNSREYWYRVAAIAGFYHGHGIKPEFTNLHRMLWRVPNMRGRPRNTYALHIGASPSQILCFQSSATWKLGESTSCNHARKDRTSILLLQLGTKSAVPYTFNGNAFSHWISTEDETAGPNYLAVLTLGWCYILSARLVEIQGQNGTMRYTESTAPGYHDSSRETTAGTSAIDIGEADYETISWWSSVLAPGEGWRAVVKQCGDGEFLAPWSMANACNRSFSIIWKRKGAAESVPSTAISSSRAFHILAQFALLHNLGSQFLVALAAAITVPTHNCHGSIIQLPQPTHTGGRCPAAPARSIPQEWIMLHDNLPYFMTLSCNPETIISCLCGSFWEPGTPCNLVSPWLHPILNEIPEEQSISATPGLYAEILAIICGIRRPSISALWLGAVTGGLTPIILRRVRRGRPPLDPVAFPWTGSPQSFMDVAGTGPYVGGKLNQEIWRADVWRLLHLPTAEEDELTYNYRPCTPWEPCGKMKISDCALRVASHFNCARHRFYYDHWNWEMEGNQIVQDEGFSTATAPVTFDASLFQVQERLQPAQKPFDQEASREASLDIFRWFIINGEGFPLGHIYKDDWLEGIADEDSDSEAEETCDISILSSKEKHDSLEQWLDTVH